MSLPPQQPPQPPQISVGNAARGKPKKTSGKAITSLVLGLLSFFCMFLTGVPAIIFGILGMGDVQKGNGRVGGNGLAIAGIVTGVLGCLWTCLGGAVLLPAVQQVREAARIQTARNDMRQLALSMLNFESAHNRFPNAIPDLDEPGKGSMLSWRVQILPWLEENNLFESFNHQEPWDSPHNLALVDKMPRFFESLSHDLPPGKTMYVVPVSKAGPEGLPPVVAAFAEGRRVTTQSIVDGASNTILLLEVDPEAAVTWTKPDDWEFDPQNPKRSVGNARLSSILVMMADGSSHQIQSSISPEEFKALITANGGEGVGVSR